MMDPASYHSSRDNVADPFSGRKDPESTPLLRTFNDIYAAKQRKRSKACVYTLGSLVLLFFLATVVLIVVLAKETGVEKLPEAARLPQWPQESISPLGVYYKAAVAADNVLCSEVGRDVLLRGGNAVDAGIATVLCTGVLDAQSCGLGGGHFTTVYNATTQTCLVIDAREVAPLAATKDMFAKNATLSQEGWLAIGVPGEIAGLYKAHQLGGSAAWRDLVQPTVDLLANGYPVSESLAKAILFKEKTIEEEFTMGIWKDPATGKGYQAGDVMRRPRLANTLAQLGAARDPAGLFYNGSIAQAIVAEFQANGALITAEDLRRYEAIVRPSVVTKLANGLQVCGPPPPSSAAVTAAVFNIVAGDPFSDANRTSEEAQAETYHKFIEAMKFGYAQRYELGDSTFGEGNLTQAQNITSKAFADWVRSRITEGAHPAEYYGGGHVREDHGTAHVSVLDQFGNAMSTTTTINWYFGAKRRSEATGIVWNNEMDDFSTPGQSNGFGFEPSAANFIYPQKRPMSSMSPLVVFNETTGEVELVVGAAGGSRIISAVSYVALRTLLFNETIKTAIDAPRLHNQLYPTETIYDEGFPEEYVQSLRDRGQNMTENAGGVVGTVVTGIGRRGGRLTANADFRKGSTAGVAGF